MNYDFRDQKNNAASADNVQAIFVLSAQNYSGFKYFRMNREKYSAYPHEKEIILADGTKTVIIGVQKVSLNLDQEAFTGLTSNVLTIIHMFTAS